ncbi:hypothetical protein MTQ13_03240 [Streptomyces sp. XM4011]|nr:hypothetical protein [Streptomyces sp. XM4011]MCK1813296.1 hypothetical protein [Streptomyces sp. XM4011]
MINFYFDPGPIRQWAAALVLTAAGITGQWDLLALGALLSAPIQID